MHCPFAGPCERVITPGDQEALPHIGKLLVGTRIWCSHFVICQSVDTYGDDADKFRQSDGSIGPPDSLHQMNDAFFMFGRGSRTCIGKDLAWIMIEKAVVAVRSFKPAKPYIENHPRGAFLQRARSCRSGSLAAEEASLRPIIYLRRITRVLY